MEERVNTLPDLAYLCYDSYFQAGRTPREVDGMDICAWMKVCGWRAARRQKEKEPKKRRLYIDDIM